MDPIDYIIRRALGPIGVLDPGQCWMSLDPGMFTSPPPSQEPRGPELLRPDHLELGPEVGGRFFEHRFGLLEKVKKSMASKMAK